MHEREAVRRSTSTAGSLAERLARLERQLRRAKVLGVVLLLLAVAGVTVGQVSNPYGSRVSALPAREELLTGLTGGQDERGGASRHRSVTAEQFVLLDGDGKARAALEVVGGTPRLVLTDAEERARILLFVAQGMPALVFRDRDGKDRLNLVLRGDDPRLEVLGKEGLPRFALGLVEGAPRLNLYDQAGKARVVLGVSEGAPKLGLLDAEQRVLFHAP